VLHAGRNVGTGSDWTLYARVTGTVRYQPNGKVHVDAAQEG